MMQWLKDILVSTRRVRPALPWMGFTALILICQWLEKGNITSHQWLRDLGRVVTIGAITAIFTRFIGGMGMFRDAIADVMLDEKWINRRNDLEEVWGKLTRHIFMPGFSSKVPEAEGLAEALKRTMSKSVLKPEQKVNYYAKNMTRRIYISWSDHSKRIVRIRDVMTVTIIPFDPKRGCEYEMNFFPTSGESIDSYTAKTEHVSVDGVDRKPEDYNPNKDGNKSTTYIKLSGRDPRLSRTVTSTQHIDNDPIFVVCAGRVVWGMQVIVHVEATDLRINFEEVGVDTCFIPEPAIATSEASAQTGQPKAKVQTWQTEFAYFTKDARLPEQGFMLVMAPIPPTLPAMPPEPQPQEPMRGVDEALTIPPDPA